MNRFALELIKEHADLFGKTALTPVIFESNYIESFLKYFINNLVRILGRDWITSVHLTQSKFYSEKVSLFIIHPKRKCKRNKTKKMNLSE